VKKLLVAALMLVGAVAFGDEGMWTYNNFPSKKVQEKYGFGPDQAWLDHARLSSVRIAGGCSASIVSPNGLIMTNHHCAHGCIEQLSTQKKDFVAAGFYAKTQAEEVKCPAMEINQLVEISDVTGQMNQATQGLSGPKYFEAQRAARAKIEKECATSDKLRCEVVTLYHGGMYDLYKYKRFQDVRLVFAPEFPIAFFGGDPDNFEFPRYDLDVSMVRIYEDNKPADTSKTYFKWSANGPREGGLSFVSGHPGGTDRNLTIAQLEHERDDALPRTLFFLEEYRGMLTEYQLRGKEQKRHSNATLFYVENSVKALKGRFEALLDQPFFGKLVAGEKELRGKVDADPKMKASAGGAWDAIASAIEQEKSIELPLMYVEGGRGFMSDYFGIAKGLVRSAAELPKPNGERLREYSDSNLPAIKARLLSKAPIYNEFEIEKLTFSLTKMREALGANSDFVHQVLGKQSPRELATAAIQGTKLGDVKVREALFNGGQKAIDASKDPFIELVKKVDPYARQLRKNVEDNIESVMDKNSEAIAKARFAMYGTSTYPDATFTLRLSYGTVKGYDVNGKHIDPITKIGGTFERATGSDPFKLPDSWLAAKSKLDLNLPMNIATDNDIIGGNSGSPVIDQNGEIIGLVFDGNIQSLGGEYGFDAAVNRTVAVASPALVEAWSKIYHAQRILDEIKPPSLNQGWNQGAAK
jgi:hypothetical protein